MSKSDVQIEIEAKFTIPDAVRQMSVRIVAAFECEPTSARISLASLGIARNGYDIDATRCDGLDICCRITDKGMLESVRVNNFLKLFAVLRFPRGVTNDNIGEYLDSLNEDDWRKAEWTYLDAFGNDDIMARAIYRLGLSDNGSIQNGLPQAISAHERLQLRLDFPPHLWPDTWERNN